MGLLFRFFSTFWSKVWAFILLSMPWVIEKVLKLLGITFVTYVGVDLLIGAVESWVFGRFDNLPVDLYKILVIADIDWAIKTIFAAFVAIAALKPLSRITS